MNSVDTTAVLNRLLILHHRSLPMYLGYAEPWFDADGDAARAALRQIVSDQQQTVDRLGELILDEGAPVAYGEFPLRFSAYHDIAFGYLRGRLVEHQQEMIREIEACVAQLQQAPTAQASAQEALGEAKAHLQILEELAGASPAPRP